MPRLRPLFLLIALAAAACGASADSGSSVMPAVRSSGESARDQAAPVVTVTLRASSTEMRTLGEAARGHGTVLAVSPDGSMAASVIGMVGADLQIWSVTGAPGIRTPRVIDVER